jgi:hypothetical protein
VKTPATLVLQFVETVLAIGAIAIELAERQYLAQLSWRDEFSSAQKIFQCPAGAASYG